MQEAASDQGWDDDGAPPPLGNISDQLHAAHLATSITGTAGLAAGDLRMAAVTDSSGQPHHSSDAQAAKQRAAPAAAASKQTFKRGFLDATPRAAGAATQQRTAARSKEAMPVLRASKARPDWHKKDVPDFLRVPLSAQEQQLSAFKSQLLSALQPTPETVSTVASNTTLMSGFDDPEVMAAVEEVGRDPKAFAKHASNPKVLSFYQEMGGLVGDKLEQLHASSGGPAPTAAAAGGGGAAAAGRQRLP